ncbi:hydroxypyruvate isomerase family protein [Paenibacillus sp. FSL H7-0331]|uniref:hydroxypyruvate isomerase family protein n=1 Tax=Paenibacillus sp. FSL H7-0331 TaxID=1920421 RepID=UPI0009700516|nr:TIM barrel protein [Paenibacillus sp. FSL H7-0331]OMF20781.1 glyoxylate-induced protein [Paenibacillus sp. FSL H7-0331]
MIYSPSIDAVFRNSGYDLDKILRTVKELGFTAFEFWGWGNRDIDLMEKLVQELDLHVGSFCTKSISLLDPALRDSFVIGLEETLVIAKRLNCKYLIAVTGNTLDGVSRAEQHQSIIDGLKACVPLLEAAGVILVLEPLNTKVNHPGYFLETSAEALAIIAEVGSPNVKLLYDVYHQQITEGDLTPTISANIGQIGYIHVADHPGRHELGTGEIAYPFVMNKLRELGYTGYVGLEFIPTGTPEDGLRACLAQLDKRL